MIVDENDDRADAEYGNGYVSGTANTFVVFDSVSATGRTTGRASSVAARDRDCNSASVAAPTKEGCGIL